MSETIYKICSRGAWEQAVGTGIYVGSQDDARDGFIHLSSPSQLAGTARKHFAGQDDLVLVQLDAARLGDALRWEPSRGGELFPHLYGDLPLEAVRTVLPLPLGPGGKHVFPEGEMT